MLDFVLFFGLVLLVMILFIGSFILIYEKLTAKSQATRALNLAEEKRRKEG